MGCLMCRALSGRGGSVKRQGDGPFNLPSGFLARKGLKPDIAMQRASRRSLSQVSWERRLEGGAQRIPALLIHPPPLASGSPERLQSRIQFLQLTQTRRYLNYLKINQETRCDRSRMKCGNREQDDCLGWLRQPVAYNMVQCYRITQRNRGKSNQKKNEPQSIPEDQKRHSPPPVCRMNNPSKYKNQVEKIRKKRKTPQPP